jgi:hypothetical protein
VVADVKALGPNELFRLDASNQTAELQSLQP